MRSVPLLWLATLALMLALVKGTDGQETQTLLDWEPLPPLPDAIGFGGPFVGVSGEALIVAGGANFPSGRPWEGHSKVWHDRVFILERANEAWSLAKTRLPTPNAYGVSLSWNGSLLCLGGSLGTRHTQGCYNLQWTQGRLTVTPLPSLPRPIANASGAIIDNVAYVLGGYEEPDSKVCLKTTYALDLENLEVGWTAITAWPGAERALSVAGSLGGHLYLFGGVRLEEGPQGTPRRIRPYLQDAYRYTPGPTLGEGTWTRIADMPQPIAAAPSPAIDVGPTHLLLLSGDDGTVHRPDIRDDHPGFSENVFAYHALTNTWRDAGTFPKHSQPQWPPVTTPTTQWRGSTIIASGEIRPGVRTPGVWSVNAHDTVRSFGWINTTVLWVYLGTLVFMGIYLSRRENSTTDFFLAGRRIPAWAAGLSIFGTQLSAITFLALPAKTYATDWIYFIQNLGIVAIAPVVVWIYLPFFRRLELRTAYEYLEQRFDIRLRLFGALSFLLFQLARMGIVLLLPSLALNAVTGVDLTLCIVLMGALCTVYTVLGGIEAVIWTDVLQVIVLLGGALLALVLMIAGIEGGVKELWHLATTQDKLRLVDPSWSVTGPSLLVILLGAVFNNLVPYTSDQAVVQRYMTTADEKRSARAVWTGAWLSFPASLLFFSVGTALFAFYTHHPERLDPQGPTDQIFAWFIAHELPVGVAGLVVAGVFAAAMSSLDSSMNSMAAVITNDGIERFHPGRTDRTLLRAARLITLALGILGTLSALFMARLGDTSLFDRFIEYVGLLGGTLAGLFALGILNPRANASGALVGAFVAVVAVVMIKIATPISGLLYATFGMTSCVLIGSLASLAFTSPTNNGTTLTWFELMRRSKD